MTDAQAPIDWYLARDGQQYGPLNEAEMRAFVDLGHLLDSDLIWRPGFADWQPAPNVFAIHPVPAAAVSAPQVAASTAELGAPADAMNAPSEPVASQPMEPASRAETPAAVTATPIRAEQGQVAAEAMLSPQARAISVPQHPDELLISPDQLLQPRQTVAAVIEPMVRAAPLPEPARDAGSAISGRGEGAGTKVRPGGSSRQVAGQGRPTRDQRVAVRPAAIDEAEDDDEPRRRLGFARIAAALIFAVLVGGLMAAVIKRDQFTSLLPKALVSLMVTDRAAVQSAPVPPALTTSAAADRHFQRLAMWRQVKQEFPEWYSERVQEATKLAAEKRTEAQIDKQSAEALVALRRKHADQALTASPERLRYVAKAFLDNLQALAKQNVDTCYGFISQGETHPAVLAMLQKPEGSDLLQAQIVAVFEAIADGRKAPQSYLPPRKGDYDALAAELTARGWSETDMRVFSDPRALGRASPRDVCRMVQDWFAAQIAIKDADTQVRLLVESLRPVVAG